MDWRKQGAKKKTDHRQTSNGLFHVYKMNHTFQYVICNVFLGTKPFLFIISSKAQNTQYKKIIPVTSMRHLECIHHVCNYPQLLTWLNLFRKERGRPFLPPPWISGFWQANILVFSCWIRNVLPSSGMYTSALWSRQALRPSSTDWDAKFNWKKTDRVMQPNNEHTPKHW